MTHPASTPTPAPLEPSPSGLGGADALRRMIAGHVAAAAAARRVDANHRLSPEASFDAAIELQKLCPDLLSQPADPVRIREEARARQMWARLRAAFGR